MLHRTDKFCVHLRGDATTLVKEGDILASATNLDIGIALDISGIDVSSCTGWDKKSICSSEGWPIVQFGGWPATSVGTFGGVVAHYRPCNFLRQVHFS